mmetsp:Transcript_23855/g.60235  ORF Transcript_23855/g.60235 Transcript_23855/m.60235 type:complete len:285 (-) Transcript_23855:632-1486(-)
MAFVLLDELVVEALVRTLRHHAFFVQDREDARGFRLQDVDRILVVREVQRIPRDALPLVELLLEFEDEGVEELLQALVCEVDTKLLKGVHLEALEAENVEHADKELDIRQETDGVVRVDNDEVEDHPVERLGQRVAVVGGLSYVDRTADALPDGHARLVAQGALEGGAVDAGELGRELDGGRALLHDHGALAVVRRSVELRVAQVQDRRDDTQNLLNVIGVDANGLHRSDAALEHLDVVDVLQGAASGTRHVREVGQVREALQIHGALGLHLFLRQHLREVVGR